MFHKFLSRQATRTSSSSTNFGICNPIEFLFDRGIGTPCRRNQLLFQNKKNSRGTAILGFHKLATHFFLQGDLLSKIFTYEKHHTTQCNHLKEIRRITATVTWQTNTTRRI
mmetsp:Transcript_19487/g.29311  ORF Transcript_19487/g.29311 Transcript_19487/m.29311 type:complete len:111 (-) Transcript_19487:2319-2651(-)